jgi:hypothetical protein
VTNLDRSVNCYFCGELFDERRTVSADPYNDHDGGETCEDCIRKQLPHTEEKCEQLAEAVLESMDMSGLVSYARSALLTQYREDANVFYECWQNYYE